MKSIRKYFWDLSEDAVKETAVILNDPNHPKYVSRMTTLLSRCDKPKEIFALINKNTFIESWPRIRKYWKKTSHAIDFLAWWETLYESITKTQHKDIPSRNLIDIGNSIKKIRLEKGLSQQDIANLTGIPQADISRIEHGHVNFKIISLLKILKILKIDNFTIKLI